MVDRHQKDSAFAGFWDSLPETFSTGETLMTALNANSCWSAYTGVTHCYRTGLSVPDDIIDCLKGNLVYLEFQHARQVGVSASMYMAMQYP